MPSSRWLIWASGAVLLAACTAGGAVVSSVPGPTATASTAAIPTLLTSDLSPVSVANPNHGAMDAFVKCHIGDQFSVDQVGGMGQVPSAKDLLHFVPLTGREPQLEEDGPAWVIRFHGDIPEGAEVWTDPTCVVTAGDTGFYATGPVKDLNTGAVRQPEPPPTAPDKTLPPLVP